MPPDTIYIPGQTGPPPPVDTFNGMDSATLMDYLRGHVDSIGQEYLRHETERPQYLFTERQMFLFVVLVLALSLFFYTVKPALDEKRRKKEIKRKAAELMTGKRYQYDSWLKKYNPYYNGMPARLQEMFLERTILFMLSKEFRYHSMEEEEYIPCLISAAAAQVTFGLRNFLMDYFSVIHVIRSEYVLEADEEMYDGHVSRTGIYISWNHFRQGFENYSDSINVGLHEMAHAVSFDAFLGKEDVYDWEFKQRLAAFREKGLPVFRSMKTGNRCILDSYGATNIDEFWAVSVECFFENPAGFKQSMPYLYQSICDLLNQDPLTPGKIIDKRLAGLVN